MANQLLSIELRGKRKQWGFLFYADPKYIPEWRADGLDVCVVENLVPTWVPGWLVRAWCFAQDVFLFKNPWRK